MNYILIGSPDKISLTSFLQFLRNDIGKSYIIGDMHSLMSEEAKSLYVDSFCSKFPKGIISYYAKGALKVDPLTCLPGKAIERADVIVWFDLYATEPVVLKDTEGFLALTLAKWSAYIAKLNV